MSEQAALDKKAIRKEHELISGAFFISKGLVIEDV